MSDKAWYWVAFWVTLAAAVVVLIVGVIKLDVMMFLTAYVICLLAAIFHTMTWESE